MASQTREVLVVDDDTSVVAMLAALLTSEGYRVRTVPDGPSALQALTDRRPDAVVLDVKMPGMSGHQVLAAIRASDGGADLPVVMLTGVDDDRNAWQAWSEGVDYFVGKPFEPADMLRYLDYLMSAEPGPEAGPGAGDGERC